MIDETNQETKYIIHIDGKCIGNHQKDGKKRKTYWIALFNRKVGESNRYYGEMEAGTNNIAELEAVLLALEKLPSNSKALIRTDSQLVFGLTTLGWDDANFRELMDKIRETAKQKNLIIEFEKIDRNENIADYVLNRHLKKAGKI